MRHWIFILSVVATFLDSFTMVDESQALSNIHSNHLCCKFVHCFPRLPTDLQLAHERLIVYSSPESELYNSLNAS